MGLQNSDYEIFYALKSESTAPGFILASQNLGEFEIHTSIGSLRDGIRFIPTYATPQFIDTINVGPIYGEAVIFSARVVDGSA